jgi:hypothetical protein
MPYLLFPPHLSNAKICKVADHGVFSSSTNDSHGRLGFTLDACKDKPRDAAADRLRARVASDGWH